MVDAVDLDVGVTAEANNANAGVIYQTNGDGKPVDPNAPAVPIENLGIDDEAVIAAAAVTLSGSRITIDLGPEWGGRRPDDNIQQIARYRIQQCNRQQNGGYRMNSGAAPVLGMETLDCYRWALLLKSWSAISMEKT